MANGKIVSRRHRQALGRNDGAACSTLEGHSSPVSAVVFPTDHYRMDVPDGSHNWYRSWDDNISFLYCNLLPPLLVALIGLRLKLYSESELRLRDVPLFSYLLVSERAFLESVWETAPTDRQDY